MTCVQAESDSGISVNLSHFDPDLTARAGQRHGDRDTGQWAHITYTAAVVDIIAIYDGRQY